MDNDYKFNMEKRMIKKTMIYHLFDFPLYDVTHCLKYERVPIRFISLKRQKPTEHITRWSNYCNFARLQGHPQCVIMIPCFFSGKLRLLHVFRCPRNATMQILCSGLIIHLWTDVELTVTKQIFWYTCRRYSVVPVFYNQTYNYDRGYQCWRILFSHRHS